MQILPPRVIAQPLGTFLDGEAWGFTLTINDTISGNPIDLTGARLYVRFCDVDDVQIGVCDSSAGNGSLTIAPGTTGQATFVVPTVNRTWQVARGPGFLQQSGAPVYGDLYCKFGAGDWQGIVRIYIPILPTTGAPPSS